MSLSLRLPTGWTPKSRAQLAALSCPADILCYGGAAGSLKAIQINALLPTPQGFLELKDVHIGDYVFDAAGNICAVTDESETYHAKRCFEIEFDNGEKIVAADDHRWVTLTEKERAQEFRRTDDFRTRRRATRKIHASKGLRKARPDLAARNRREAEARRSNLLRAVSGNIHTTLDIACSLTGHDGRPNHSVTGPPRLAGLDAIDLLIDPYVLGAWLGDGSKDGGGYCSADPEIPAAIRAAGYEIEPGKAKYSWYIKGFVPLLRKLGVWRNKHIPAQYLRASFDQRLALLQGLMDTDGSANPERGAIFYNTNRALVEQVRELLLTLGVKAEISEWTARLDGRDMGPCYGISFVSDFCAFRLPRKATKQRLRSRKTAERRYIVAVREVPSVPVRCIAVDSPTHTFLVSRSFIPTHNSETCIIAALQYIDSPHHKALILRKTSPEFRFLVNRSRSYYPQFGGKYNGNDKTWRFPSGATVEFGFCEREEHVYRYQGDAYTFVGFDESTHFKESQVRYVISRMRCVDPRVKVQLFLPTNPGNLGHAWHKSVFHGPKCTHCIEQEIKEKELTGDAAAAYWAAYPMARIPFKIYKDALWPSDFKKIGQTTCFIPGRLTDHELYGIGGVRYLPKLEGLPDKLKEALLDGCWEAFEGQFFDCWNPEKNIISPDEFRDIYKPWWTTWTSTDYGFRHLAANFVHAMDPDSNVYTFDEYAVRRTMATDLALEINSRWNEFNPSQFFLSPDSFKHDGQTDLSIAEQMISTSGIGFEPAYNERISGARLCYDLLAHGKGKIVSSCRGLLKSIQTRVHDPSRPEDVLKTEEDEDDYYDGWRYGWASMVQPSERPIEEQIDEMVTSNDPTTAMLQRLIAQNKLGGGKHALVEYRNSRRRQR